MSLYLVQKEVFKDCCQKQTERSLLFSEEGLRWAPTQKCAISTTQPKYWRDLWCIHLWLFLRLGRNQLRQLPRGINPHNSRKLNFKGLTVGRRGGLQYIKRKQKAGERVEWWCDTLLKQATVPMPLSVCLWAHVALIAASTEPADCTHYLSLASKKPHAELYEIFIQCVHFSSLFPLFLPFPIPHLGPPLPF